MEDIFFGAAYKGSKEFSQNDVNTANATGFGAAADDFMERGIDLNERLVMNKPSTFFFKMDSDSMENAGIFQGDILIVDRSIKAISGKIIIAAFEGELLIRRYIQNGDRQSLRAEHDLLKEIEITRTARFQVWGVVTCAIHMVDPSLITFSKDIKKKKKEKINI